MPTAIKQAEQENARITLQMLWEAYNQICVPKGASQMQVEATKRAFFAGAHAIFMLMLKLKPNTLEDMTPDNILEGVQKLSALHDELDAFVRE